MDIQRIQKSVLVVDSGCWIWQKSCNSAGYGQLTEAKRYWLAHRYAYQCIYGDLSVVDVVRHTCHRPRCCNPEHLQKGSHKDNYHDSYDVHATAQDKRALGWSIGSNSYRTIREANKETGISQASIQKYTCDITGIFNVEAYRIGAIRAGWKPKI